MCHEAGVYGIICFGMGLTLRMGNREYFYRKLDEHFPGLKETYISAYGLSYELESPNGRELMRFFHRQCEKYGIVHNNDKIFEYLYKFENKEEGKQLTLF